MFEKRLTDEQFEQIEAAIGQYEILRDALKKDSLVVLKTKGVKNSQHVVRIRIITREFQISSTSGNPVKIDTFDNFTEIYCARALKTDQDVDDFIEQLIWFDEQALCFIQNIQVFDKKTTTPVFRYKS